MKLYTICKLNECEIKTEDNYGIKLVEYSVSDYKRFIEKAMSHYVCYHRYWYDTDMSDSSSGTITRKFSINQSNMVIKDNELYGILANCNMNYPKYYIYQFGKEKLKIELGGGYCDDSHEWVYKENDLSNLETLYASLSYVLIKEKICFSNKNEETKMYLYERTIIGLLQKDCLIENGKVVGFTYDNNNFILASLDSFVQKTHERREYTSESTDVYEVYTLVKVSKEFLEENILNISYDDYRSGHYKVFTEIKC